MNIIVYSTDKANSLPIRQANREAHLAWLRSDETVSVKVAGPWLDSEGEMRGSLLIVDAESLDAVKLWLSRDPYRHAGLTESTQVNAYNWVIGAPKTP